MIDIDLSELREAGVPKKTVFQFAKALSKGIVLDVYEKIRQKAVMGLRSSKMRYLQGLSFKETKFGGEVSLEDPLAEAVETGTSGFDMKSGLLSGPNSKIDQAGNRYNIVPFYYTTGTNKEGQFNGGTISKTLFQKVKKGQDTSNYLAKLSDNERKNLKGITLQGDRPTSYRRVSVNSDSRSWIHPGWMKRGFFQKVTDNYDPSPVLQKLKNEFFR